MVAPSRLFSIPETSQRRTWEAFIKIIELPVSARFSTFLIALLVAISYYGGVRIGIALTPPQQAISTFWPPNAILLAAFLLTRPRTWWIIVAAVLPAHLLAEGLAGIPLFTVLGWFVGNVGEALLGAFCITYFAKSKPLFESVQGVVTFLIFGAFGAPLVTTFIDAAVVAETLNDSYWLSWTLRLFSNALAEIMLVPMIVTFFSNRVAIIRRVSFPRFIEFVALITGVVAVSVLVFGGPHTNNIPALVYAPISLLLWATVRFGPAGLSASLLTLSYIAVRNAFNGHGFLSGTLRPNVLSLQILLCVVAVPLLLLAAVLIEREHVEESLRNTSGKLIYAQEQERQRIARDLHDDIAQQLALAQLEMVQLRDGADQDLASRLHEVQTRLSEISTATHELSHGLHPSQLAHLGLSSAIKGLIRDANKTEQLEVRMEETNVPDNVPENIALALFRVAQEALHNIVKHSKARTGAVALRLAGRELILRISDDGVGFCPLHVSGRGLGLESMRERIRSLNGTFMITSEPDQGTMIEAVVPVQNSPLRNSAAA